MGHSFKYVFYYKVNENSKRTIVEVKTCIKPKATKVYKKLINMLDKRAVHCVGFDLASNQ